MDPKEYISSGKLEEYVLGLVSAETMQEVECMARVFPEIREELAALQLSLEKTIFENQVTPPPQLKKQILDLLDEEVQPVMTKLIQPPIKETSGSGSRWMVLALGILTLLLIITAWFGYQKTNQLTKELDTFKSEQLELNKNVEDLNRTLELRNQELRLIRDPQNEAITLSGTPLSPASLAKIYWSKQNQEVYLEVHRLPAPPQGKQYQLWGIVAGKPVDLGVFDLPTPEESAMIKMKDVNGATTFAITIEPTGGNPGPTLDQMVVAGNVPAESN